MDYRDVSLICLVRSILISITLNGVTSFSRIKNLGNTGECPTVNVLGGISFHVMAENWKHLKDTLPFHFFSV